ncbi:MAG: Gldg family protein [Phycisphaerales bacterium]|nr:Gldg family protein [Phycisphaerales bacterium]
MSNAGQPPIWPAIRALVTREVRAFLLAPSGWVVLALFAFGSSLVFLMGVFQSGRPATMRFVLEFDAIFMMLAAPAVTMAAIGEERRRGTWELLCSGPVAVWALVLSKFLGAAIIAGLMLALPSIWQIMLLEVHGRPDLGEVFCGLVGVYLLTLAVMASGLLASALTGGATSAFLITALSWVLTVVVLEMALPAVVSPQWAHVLSDLDPVRRLQSFTLGLFDTGNVAYFLGLIVFFLVGARVMAVPGRRRLDAPGLAALACGLVAVVALAGMAPFNWRVDATKSRLYSLSPRTQSLLGDLPGDWRIAVLLVEDRADPALLEQVDEVLGRYAAAAPNLRVQRIDPTDPDSILEFEELLADLRTTMRTETATWDAALDQGEDALGDLVLFAQSAAAALRERAMRVTDDQLRDALQVRAAALALLGAEGGRLVDAVAKARTVTPAHPLADPGTAISILKQALGQWAEELDATGRLLTLIDEDEFESSMWRERASELARAADTLQQLPESELSTMGQLLAQGEAALIIGPDGAAVVPAAQLLPSALGEAIGGIAIDQRFRGDQVLASAIRSIRDGSTPRVVFVHAEEGSLLDGSQPADVSGPAAMLAASRIEVQEWRPSSGTQPEPWRSGPTAWVILPPTRSGGLKPTEAEQALTHAAVDLVGRGEGVMINLNPSLMPRYGQSDPWARLLRSVGIEADTSKVLLQALPSRDGGEALSTAVHLADFPADHPVAAALHGQDLRLPMSVPLGVLDDRAIALGVRQVEEGIWLEGDWRVLTMGESVPSHRLPRFDSSAVPEEDVPVVVASERDTISGGSGRVLAVGSGPWLRTSVADQAVGAGGGRIALAHPGNHELLLAGTAWLAGLDEQIAAGPLSQEVARLGAVSRGARTFWGWMLLGLLPVGLLVAGGAIHAGRRSA